MHAIEPTSCFLLPLLYLNFITLKIYNNYDVMESYKSSNVTHNVTFSECMFYFLLRYFFFFTKIIFFVAFLLLSMHLLIIITTFIILSLIVISCNAPDICTYTESSIMLANSFGIIGELYVFRTQIE